MSRYLICFLFFLFGCNSKKPAAIKSKDLDFYEKCRQLVLSEKQIGKEYFFSRKGNNIDEMSIVYLGDIVTIKKDTLHVLNSINYSGKLVDAKHGSGNVFIYSSIDQKVRYYYVGSSWAVPSKIENGNLIFNYSNGVCNQSTKISLFDSIPQQIFINCTSNGGDLYNLLIED